jgi:predicted ATPase/class 3 adenylate cyclase
MRPSGTIVLLFTDVEGSTRRWERYAGVMGEAMRRHDAAMQAAIESNGGYVFKTIGDAFCAAFSRVDQAISAALAAQRALAEADFSEVEGMRVRMALHVGICEERDGDYFGPVVNRVARLLSIGHGGQVLLSASATELAHGHLPAGVSLAEMGTHQLKDLSQPERVAALVAAGLRADAPPLRSLSTMANNLPQHLTPIIGREREALEIERALHESRVVSIAGAGGIGKTRIALQVAANAVDDFDDGVWFADLAPIADPALVAGTVASAAGFELPANQEPLAALAATLKTQRCLLVLDNCEHVMHSAAQLAETIVRLCPHVSILATTRERLGIPGESVYRLDTLDDASAVALFVVRAQAADQRFALSSGDVAVVTDICRRLDGIALAIELAAARVRLLPPKALLGKLDERFRLLTGGSRTALPRQQTMRALIDWSYDLLSEDERTVFRRLGVFAGGFTIDAASEAVADDDVESWDVLDRLSTLVDKSMVVCVEGERRRYRLLESIRQYALERLKEAGEEDRIRRAHACFFDALAVTAEAGMGVGSEAEWMATYEPDFDNFRSAIDWSLRNDAFAAVRIAGNLTRCWSYFGLDAEGLRHSEAALAAIGDRADAPEAFAAWLSIAIHARTMGATRRSLEAADRALAIAVASGDSARASEARATSGWPRFMIGDKEQARAELWDAVEYYRRQNRPMRRARALMNYAAAIDDPEAKRELLEEVVKCDLDSGWQRASLQADSNLAEEDCARGDFASAIERARRILNAFRERKSPLDLTGALSNIGSYLALAGAYAEARAAASEALHLAVSYEWHHYVGFCVQTIALADAAEGQLQLAAQLLGFVDRVLESLEGGRETTEAQVYDRLTGLLRAGLEDAEVGRACAAGRALSTEQACALALASVAP